MSIKIRIPRRSSLTPGKFFQQDALLRTGMAVFILATAVVVGVFAFYYVRYARIVDQRLSGPIGKILRKGSLGQEQLLAEVSALMAGARKG